MVQLQLIEQIIQSLTDQTQPLVMTTHLLILYRMVMAVLLQHLLLLYVFAHDFDLINDIISRLHKAQGESAGGFKSH